MLAAGQADVPHDAHQPAAGDEDTEAVPPHLVELVVEGVIIFDVPKLAFGVGIFLERPVRRGGQDQVH
jgi:hypothetical protein